MNSAHLYPVLRKAKSARPALTRAALRARPGHCRISITSLLAVIFLAGCAETTSELQFSNAPLYQPPEITVTTVTYYKESPGTALLGFSPARAWQLDLYRPPTGNLPRRPCVVVLHGGAFCKGDRHDPGAVYLAEQLSRRGIIVASIDYRQLLPTALSLFKASYAAAQDARAAVRFLRANASTYGIHPDYIALAGISAGAVTALHAACLRKNEPFDTRLEMLDNKYGSIDSQGDYNETSATVFAVASIGGGVIDTNLIDRGIRA